MLAIDSTARCLIAAGQESHSVPVHPVGASTGKLEEPARLSVGKNPNWIEISDLP